MLNRLLVWERLRTTAPRQIAKYTFRRVGGLVYYRFLRPPLLNTQRKRAPKLLNLERIGHEDHLIRCIWSKRELDEIVDIVHKYYSIHCERVELAAESLLRGSINLIGFGDHSLNYPNDWHSDRLSGYRWPLIHHLVLSHNYYGKEVKFPWELSRGHHWVTLAQAYRYTGDERFSQACLRDWLDWIEANPAHFGINWSCAMEVAIRLVNWLWAYTLINGSTAITPELELDLARILAEHGAFIERNLENRRAVTNHYVANGVGLLYAGCLLPIARGSEKWRRLGQEILWSQCVYQVYEEGTSYERSTAYHRFSLELFFAGVLLAHRYGLEVPLIVIDRLERMFEVVNAFTDAGGRFPLIGDNDSGTLLRFDLESPERADNLLKVGSTFFNRSSWARWPEAGVNALLHLGPSAHNRYAKLTSEVAQKRRSWVFPRAGWVFLRGEGGHVSFCAGPFRQRGLVGGHGHNDALSITVTIGERRLIIDPGTFCYFLRPELRQLFRSSAYHNTLVIDGAEINPIQQDQISVLPNVARPRIINYGETGSVSFVVGEHDGYCRLPDPVKVRRTLITDLDRLDIVIVDQVITSDVHKVEQWFHFSPDVEVKSLSNLPGIRLRIGEKDVFLVVISECDISHRLVKYEVAFLYGSSVTAEAICIETTAHGNIQLVAALLCRTKDTPEPERDSIIDWIRNVSHEFGMKIDDTERDRYAEYML